MRHKRRSALGALATLAVGTAFLLIVPSLLSRPSQSFGAVQTADSGNILVALPAKVDHRFPIRNDSTQKVDLVEARPACGCTSWSISARSMEPGQTVEVEMQMSIYRAGAFRTSMEPEWSDGTRSILCLVGAASPPSTAWLSHSRLGVLPGGLSRVSISLATLRPAVPEIPELQVVPGATMDFGQWEVVLPGDRDKGIAARFQMTATVTVDAAAVLPTDLEVTVPQCSSLTMTLVSP